MLTINQRKLNFVSRFWVTQEWIIVKRKCQDFHVYKAESIFGEKIITLYLQNRLCRVQSVILAVFVYVIFFFQIMLTCAYHNPNFFFFCFGVVTPWDFFTAFPVPRWKRWYTVDLQAVKVFLNIFGNQTWTSWSMGQPSIHWAMLARPKWLLKKLLILVYRGFWQQELTN